MSPVGAVDEGTSGASTNGASTSGSSTSDERAPAARSGDELSRLVVLLLKGVVYRDHELAGWIQLVARQAHARDYLSVLGLDLVIDEAEGYAFVRSRPGDDDESDGDAGGRAAPRLVARRPLSFPVSLILALLRRKLAEADARNGDTRLVLTRDEIADLVRVFLPERADEARLLGQIDVYIGKVVDLGFLKRLGGANASGPPSFEVRRIIKAFVDAQWLFGFDDRLGKYRASLERDLAGRSPAGPVAAARNGGTSDDG